MSENKYNITIRRAISDKYIECARRRKQKQDELMEVSRKLAEGKKTIPYQNYLNLKDSSTLLLKEIEDLSVELNTWDKARELCLNIIDEKDSK